MGRGRKKWEIKEKEAKKELRRQARTFPYRSCSVRCVECEGQEKIWTEVWGSPPREEQSGGNYKN